MSGSGEGFRSRRPFGEVTSERVIGVAASIQTMLDGVFPSAATFLTNINPLMVWGFGLLVAVVVVTTFAAIIRG